MGIRKTNEQFKKEVYDLVGDEYTFLEEYINARTKIKVKHAICGSTYEVTPAKFLFGTRCPFCAKNKKKTTESFKKQLFDKYGDEYTLLSNYVNSTTKVTVIHNSCGHKYEVLPPSILAGHGCMKCYGSEKKTTETFKEEVYDLFENEYTVLGEYSCNKQKIRVKHNVCGYEYDTTPTNFLKKCGCPFCANNILKTDEQFKKEVYDLVGNEYTVVGDYINNKTKIKIIHNNCKHEYEILPTNFLAGERCPKCVFKGISRIEKEILDYIKLILPDEEIIENDCTILNGKEIDILLPNRKIGIEFDGLYWHTTEFKDKDFHLNKTKLAKEKGVRLIHIFEDEWRDNQDLIKKKISHILNCDNSERIFARKCEIKKIIDTKIKSNFLNENHIQGSDRCNFAYGLYYNNKLVALMSFIKPRVSMGRKDSNEGEYELSRYATSCNVIGGFAKLLKHCIESENIKEIYTYADLRWTNPDSNIYLKNGFKYVSTSQPNYWYVINGEREGRFIYQKAKLKKLFPKIFSNDKTEEEIMIEAGFYRIYDCGNLKYELKI